MAETFLPAGVLSGGDLRRSQRTLGAALHEKQSSEIASSGRERPPCNDTIRDFEKALPHFPFDLTTS
jgi:hypothetical protein